MPVVLSPATIAEMESAVIDLLTSAGVSLPESANVTSAVNAAIAEVENRTGRSFTVVTETRRYDGTGRQSVFIDPCSDITLIQHQDFSGSSLTPYASTEWVAYPLNKTTKEWLERPSWCVWWSGKGNVRVSATFGEPVPDDLYLAMIEMASATIGPSFIHLATGGIKSYKEGDITVDYGDKSVTQVLEGWQKDVDRVLSGYQRFTI